LALNTNQSINQLIYVFIFVEIQLPKKEENWFLVAAILNCTKETLHMYLLLHKLTGNSKWMG